MGFRETVVATLNAILESYKIATHVVDGAMLLNAIEERGIAIAPIAPTSAAAIAANQIITPAMSPGADSVLETTDGAGDRFDQVGPDVVFPKYKAPKDPRVQQVLKDAAREREAAPVERTIFSDPRLDPKYRPPKSK